MSLIGLKNNDDHLKERSFEKFLNAAHQFDEDIKLKEKRKSIFTSIDRAGNPVVIKFSYEKDSTDNSIAVIDGKTVDFASVNDQGKFTRYQSDITEPENEYYKMLYDRYIFFKIFKPKDIDASNLFSCYVKHYDGDTNKCINELKTVVYRSGDIYWDMRRIFWASELKEKSVSISKNFQLYYLKDESTYPSFYHDIRCVLIGRSLKNFYPEDKKTFTLPEIQKDMVSDWNIYTSWPGFSTKTEDDIKRGKRSRY